MQAHHITLAVYPFDDLASPEAPGIICRSFTEDLVTELSRFRQLSVVRANGTSIQHAYFVKGTFRTEQNNIKVNVQLYDGATHRLIWGNRFEDAMSALSDMHDRLLKSVVMVLQQQIDADLLSRIKQRPKVAFSAYEHWLYGMDELRKGTLDADVKARSHFEQALAIQPDYALACTGMSLSYFNEWTCQLWDRWDLSKSGAAEWAQKAIELDEQNHIICMVLGRVFLYEGSLGTAEYYFRRSLLLNPNDPDTLFTIALYMVYLGLGEEARDLYERALALHPFHSVNHMRVGGFIYFELGDYEKAATIITANQSGRSVIADTDAYCAATYYYLKQYDKMEFYWNSFLNTYRRLIAKGNDFDPQEAIDWLLKLNPHRLKTNMEAFLRFISQGRFEKFPMQRTLEEKEPTNNFTFVRENAIWKLAYDGETIQAPEAKGFFDIQKMLQHPRQLFHCAELMGTTLDGSGEKLIDEKARKQYQQKIIELQRDMEDAEEQGHYDRLEKLQHEYDQLVEHLSQSLNLKGRIRESGGTVEKARSAVTWRIRNAIARVEQYHPLLGAHLSNAIKTGTFCSYKPDRKISWITA